jgi:hypothetical protein
MVTDFLVLPIYYLIATVVIPIVQRRKMSAKERE